MAEPVTQILRRAPERVVISTDYTPAFTPRELDMIKAATGRAYSQIIADDNSDERMIVTAWLKTRRDGYDVTLDDMADVVIELAAGEPDPTNEGRSSSSSTSAASGT